MIVTDIPQYTWCLWFQLCSCNSKLCSSLGLTACNVHWKVHSAEICNSIQFRHLQLPIVVFAQMLCRILVIKSKRNKFTWSFFYLKRMVVVGYVYCTHLNEACNSEGVQEIGWYFIYAASEADHGWGCCVVSGMSLPSLGHDRHLTILHYVI